MIISIGTKPELIKMVGILRELDQRKYNYFFLNLGQHGMYLESINKLFKLKPFDVNLSVNNDLDTISSVLYWFIKHILNNGNLKIQSNNMIIHGDTPSTLLGFCLSKLWNSKLIHIESGLRSFDIHNPFPEELIRKIVDYGSDILFAPSNVSYRNLINEKRSGIIINTKYNTILDTIHIAINRKPICHIPKEDYILVSVHRVENIYSYRKMKLLTSILMNIDTNVIWPLHLPTKKRLIKYHLLNKLKNVELIGYQDYISFIHLMKNAIYVITDSGGPQEELSFLGTPCLLYRSKIERYCGINKNVFISKYDKNRINYFMKKYENFKNNSFIPNFSPSKFIIDTLEKLKII